MGNVSSHGEDSILTPPPDYVTPPFPSLYNPARELNQPNGNITDGVYYLYYSKDIYKFTLYWTLIVYVPMYLLCGVYGLIVHLSSRRRKVSKLAFFGPIMYVLAGMFYGVVASAIIGYSLAAVYSVGRFRMSTWVPFLWSIVVTLVTIIGSYSTIVYIL